MSLDSSQVCSSLNLQDPPAGLPLNSNDGDMWMTLNLLFSSNNFKADKLNYQMAMNAIHRFFTLYPAGSGATPPTDPYLHQLWSELQATNGDEPESLYSMSQNYNTSGYSDTDFQNFTKMVSDVTNGNIPDSILKDFMGDLNTFASHNTTPGEGSYMSYAQTLSKRDLGNIVQYDFPVSANAASFLSDLKTLQLTIPQSNLDGVSQFLADILSVKLDPTNPNSSLGQLAASGDVTTLQSLLTSNPQLDTELQTMFTTAMGLEFPSS